MEIPLKQKYLVGGTSRYRSSGGTSGVRKVKLGGDKRRGVNQPPEQQRVMMYLLPSGKKRMRRG